MDSCEGVVLASGQLVQLWLPAKGVVLPSGQIASLVGDSKRLKVCDKKKGFNKRTSTN